MDFKHLSIRYGSDDLRKFLEDDMGVREIAETWIDSSRDYMEARKAAQNVSDRNHNNRIFCKQTWLIF